MGDSERRIRAKARELGFCKVGFTSMDDLPRVSDQAQKRAYPQFFEEMIERGSHPRDLFPAGRSIIVLAYDYARHRYPEKLLRHVARTYLSRSYLPLEKRPRAIGSTLSRVSSPNRAYGSSPTEIS